MANDNSSGLRADTHLYAGNSVFMEELHRLYIENPSLVNPDWQRFFANMGHEAEKDASWADSPTAIIGQIDPDDLAALKEKQKNAPAAAPQSGMNNDSVRALMMIHAHRVRGHLAANLDPLGLEEKEPHPELDPATYGFGSQDMDKDIELDGVLGLQNAKLKDILQILRQTYCGKIGVEFMHIQYPDQKQWIQERIENMRGTPDISIKQKKDLLHYLIEVEAFEDFLHVKYPGMKRFSVQGGDVMVAGLEVIIETASKKGVEEIVIG